MYQDKMINMGKGKIINLFPKSNDTYDKYLLFRFRTILQNFSIYSIIVILSLKQTKNINLIHFDFFTIDKMYK